MKKASSCIAVFSRYADGKNAAGELIAASVDRAAISLVDKELQQGKVANSGLGSLDDDLLQLGVLKSSLYCYKCMLYAGSCLLIVSGNYQQIEHACALLEQYQQADVSMHYNSDSSQI